MSNSEATIAPSAHSTLTEPRSWSGAALLPLERGRGAWLAASAGVLAIAYIPLVWMFFEQQWEKPHYQFFPFVIGAFGWLLWTRWQQSTPIVGSRSNYQVIVFLQLGAAGLLLFALAIRSPWLAMISLIVLVAAWFRKISETRQSDKFVGDLAVAVARCSSTEKPRSGAHYSASIRKQSIKQLRIGQPEHRSSHGWQYAVTEFQTVVCG